MNDKTILGRPGEPLVTLAGPCDHGDVEDVATGLRFIRGKAAGVPLSVAERVARERRGYYIEPAKAEHE